MTTYLAVSLLAGVSLAQVGDDCRLGAAAGRKLLETPGAVETVARLVPERTTLPRPGDTVLLHVFSTKVDGRRDLRVETRARVKHALHFTSDRVLAQADSAAELAGILRELVSRKLTVRKLILDSHGCSAYTPIVESGSVDQLSGLDVAMAPDAEISFIACGVAEDAEGRRFLEKLGRTLLTKGGAVVAAKDTYYDSSFLGTSRGFVEVRVLPGGETRFEEVGPGAQLARDGYSVIKEKRRDVLRIVSDGAVDFSPLGLLEKPRRVAKDVVRDGRNAVWKAEDEVERRVFVVVREGEKAAVEAPKFAARTAVDAYSTVDRGVTVVKVGGKAVVGYVGSKLRGLLGD